MARAASIVINVIDAKGKASKTRVFAPSSLTVAQVQTWGESMAQHIANLSQGRVTRVSVCVPVDLTVGNTLKTVANALGDVATKALFVWNSITAGFKLKFNLPTWDETQTLANTDTVDTSDISVAALITALEAGIVTSTLATVLISNSRGDEIDTLDYAKEKFRNI